MTDNGYSEIIDYAAQRFSTDCAAALTNTGGKLACHFIDPAAAFTADSGDRNPANFAADLLSLSMGGNGSPHEPSLT